MIRRISWISVLSLSISVASLVIVMSVMKALNTSIYQKTLAVEPHLWIEVLGVSNAELLKLHPITQRLANYRVEVAETQDVIIRSLEGRFVGGQARGMSEDNLSKMLADAKLSYAEVAEKKLEPGEVILGSDLAIQLGALIGDTLIVLPPESLLLPLGETPQIEKVKVKEIITTELKDVDSQSLFYVRGKSLIRLKDRASLKLGFEVFLPNPYQAAKVKDELSSFEGLIIETWQERNSALFLALKIERFIIGTFLSLASLIAVFSISSLVVLLVSQKKKEIGILQAIGLSPQRTQFLFSMVGTILGFSGLFLGGLLGLGTSAYLEKYPLKVLPDIYYDSSIPAELDWGVIAMALLVGMGVILVEAKVSSSAIKSFKMSDALRSKN